ncbi:hypothetical protein [Aquibacillus kalidii]|uniref:hypothetical protein n=1 Tax=Aquibacillus kalidii TaxID=2762597 RepID=UPI0016495E35|nr:hypothetical protein [Aquibacillus kalidii]
MGTRKVYLLFSDTGTLLTRAINICTNSTLNHASIALDEGLQEVYSFGRKSPRNPFIGGFVKEDLRIPFFNKAKCAVYSFSVSDLEFNKIRKIIYEMEANKSEYRYNVLGLFGVFINKELERKNAFFCSQFIATILSDCGIYENKKPHCLTKPQDLRQWYQLKLIYQGDLSSYLTSAESASTIITEKQLNLV